MTTLTTSDAPSTPAPRAGKTRFWTGLATAALSGVVMLLAFPSYNLWYLAPISVALLALACHRRTLKVGALYGAVAGALFFGPLLNWTSTHVGPAPWLLLVGLQTAYFALLGMASAWVSPVVDRWRWSWPLVTGVLWVGQEALRSRTPFGGFPWGRIAFSQADSPVLNVAVVGGAVLVTFLVAAAGGLLAIAGWVVAGQRLWADEGGPGRRRSWTATTHPARSAGAAVIGAAALVAVGLLIPTAQPNGRAVTIAIVQGNVPRMGLDFNAQRAAVLDNHVQATIDLGDQVRAGNANQPDLVIWPENSSDIDPLINKDASRRIQDAADWIKAPILVGAVLEGPGENHARNAGIVWSPTTGAGQMYVKRHPVPFAEYLPMRPIVEPIALAITDKAGLLRSDFLPGTDSSVLAMGPASIGDVICFEVAYDNLVRDTVNDGAGLLVTQTNNATFNVDEARQQLAMVRLRSVEHGRDGLMASTVGISGFVTADGGVHQASAFFTKSVSVGELHTSTSRTLATRLGAFPEGVLAALALGVLVLAGIVRRSGNRRAKDLEAV